MGSIGADLCRKIYPEPVDDFDRLPDSLILLIFNKIEDVKALGRCCVVSRRFHSLVPQVDNVVVRVDCVISDDDPSSNSSSSSSASAAGKGKGLPKSGFMVTHGDQYIRFCIKLPPTVTERQRAILEEFEKEQLDENNRSAAGSWDSWSQCSDIYHGSEYLLHT